MWLLQLHSAIHPSTRSKILLTAVHLVPRFCSVLVCNLCDINLAFHYLSTFGSRIPVVSCFGHDVHRHEANYNPDDYSDYGDTYPYAHANHHLATSQRFPTL